MEKCDRCNGLGYEIIILKTRALGITTYGPKSGDKVPCPKCGGKK